MLSDLGTRSRSSKPADSLVDDVLVAKGEDVLFSDPVEPLLTAADKLGGLGFGGGVALPKECFLGDGNELPLVSFIDFRWILSELPFNFSRLELAELPAESGNLRNEPLVDDFPDVGAGILLVPGGLEGFLTFT